MKRKEILIRVMGVLGLIILCYGCGGTDSSSSSTSSYAGPGSHYTFSFTGSTFEIKKYATRTSTSADFTVSGTSTDISATGFKKLTVSSVTGSGGPSAGDTAYALEIPGVALFLKPIASGSNQILTAVSTGSCPTSTMNANWVMVKTSSGSDVSSNSQDLYGTFQYVSSTGVASLPAKYSLQNNSTSLGSNTFASATCSNGLMAVSNGGGDNAVMYLTTIGAALVNTAESNSGNASYILGFPASSISGASLAGSYAGILFSEADATEKVRPIAMTLTFASGQMTGTGSKVTDITTGATASGGASLTITAFNSPSNGFMTGTLTAGATTTNVACMGVQNVNSTSKNVINCVGRDPGDATKLFNFLLVSK